MKFLYYTASLCYCFSLTFQVDAFVAPSPLLATAVASIDGRHASTTRLTLSMSSTSISGGVEQASAAAAFAGAGDIQVDMNQYNLGLPASASEWTARLSAMGDAFHEAGTAFLDAKTPKRVMVDTLKIVVPRKPGQGLGLELLELAGGREDGLGITMVEGLVPGGCAERSGLLPGDSLSKIAIRNGKDDSRSETDAVSTECLGFDRTIEAITSLPPPAEDGSSLLVLTVKRLRYKPTVQLTLQFPPHEEKEDVTLELFAGENLRRAMLTRGVKLNDPLARRFDSGGSGDCGADGTCATCTVGVQDGMHLLNPPAQIEGQIFKRHADWRMACKAIVGFGLQQGELTLRVNPRQWDD